MPSRPTFTGRVSRRASLLIALAAVSPWALAQSAGKAAATAPAPLAWPTKPLKIIVGFPAGTSPDLTARTFSEPLSKALGQPVIVDNKVGAGGNIGADAVAKARDDHTIGLMINGNMTIAKLLNPAVPYAPLTDLAPLSLIGTSPLILTAPVHQPGVAANGTAQDFFVAARNGGDKWSYGTPGVGTVGHIGMELLKSRAGIAPVHVPYPGYPQVFNAMVGGDLQLSMLPPALANTQIKAGKLRGIGVTSSGRSTLVPDLPSLAEAGVKDFNLEIWNAVAAPASMPKAHVEKLAAAVSAIVRAPEMRQRLFQQGWQAVGSSPEGLANRIRSDAQVLGGIIRTQGIKAE